MTLIEIKNALINHFMSSSTFNVEVDTDGFQLDPKEVGGDLLDHLKAITVSALDEMVKVGLVAKVEPGFYILVQPLSQVNQTLVLSPFTACMLSDIVNGWMEKTGESKDTGYIVNKMAITDRDINSICQICAILLSNQDDGGMMMEEDDDEEGTEGDPPPRPPAGRTS